MRSIWGGPERLFRPALMVSITDTLLIINYLHLTHFLQCHSPLDGLLKKWMLLVRILKSFYLEEKNDEHIYLADWQCELTEKAREGLICGWRWQMGQGILHNLQSPSCPSYALLLILDTTMAATSFLPGVCFWYYTIMADQSVGWFIIHQVNICYWLQLIATENELLRLIDFVFSLLSCLICAIVLPISNGRLTFSLVD